VLNIGDSAWFLLGAGAAILGFAFIFLYTKKKEWFEKLKFWKRKNKRRKF